MNNINETQKCNFFAIKHIKAIVTICVLSFLAASISFAGYNETATKLEKLRLTIEKNPTKVNEMAYLKEFPRTFKLYSAIFNPPDFDRLYPKCGEHLALLKELSEKYPKIVLSIWLDVSVNGHWDADAIGGLQHQLIGYASMNTKDFTTAILSRTHSEQESIISFLADVENHSVYYDYQQTMNNLKSLNQQDLYQMFISAKEKRIKAGPHGKVK